MKLLTILLGLLLAMAPAPAYAAGTTATVSHDLDVTNVGKELFYICPSWWETAPTWASSCPGNVFTLHPGWNSKACCFPDVDAIYIPRDYQLWQSVYGPDEFIASRVCHPGAWRKVSPGILEHHKNVYLKYKSCW